MLNVYQTNVYFNRNRIRMCNPMVTSEIREEFHLRIREYTS